VLDGKASEHLLIGEQRVDGRVGVFERIEVGGDVPTKGRIRPASVCHRRPEDGRDLLQRQGRGSGSVRTLHHFSSLGSQIVARPALSPLSSK
jgi:hypothetical protein